MTSSWRALTTSTSTRPSAFVQAVEGLVKASGLEQRLSNLNVDQASLPVMASEVVVGIRRLIDSNPCDMIEQDVEAIYRSIY